MEYASSDKLTCLSLAPSFWSCSVFFWLGFKNYLFQVLFVNANKEILMIERYSPSYPFFLEKFYVKLLHEIWIIDELTSF